MNNPIILPIYYTQTFKTKDDKVWLVGDNAFRNWHYHLKNKVKQHYHKLVANQVLNHLPLPNQFTLHIDVFYKNPNMDASNVSSRMEKFTLDALQEAGIIVNDNVKYHMGSCWVNKGQDKQNPRVEISISTVI